MKADLLPQDIILYYIFSDMWDLGSAFVQFYSILKTKTSATTIKVHSSIRKKERPKFLTG